MSRTINIDSARLDQLIGEEFQDKPAAPGPDIDRLVDEEFGSDAGPMPTRLRDSYEFDSAGNFKEQPAEQRRSGASPELLSSLAGTVRSGIVDFARGEQATGPSMRDAVPDPFARQAAESAKAAREIPAATRFEQGIQSSTRRAGQGLSRALAAVGVPGMQEGSEQYGREAEQAAARAGGMVGAAGRLAGDLGQMSAIGMGGPIATGIVYGVENFGAAHAEMDQWEKETGQQIPPVERNAIAVGKGLLGGLATAYIPGKSFGEIGNQTAREIGFMIAKGEFTQAGVAAAKVLGLEGMESAVVMGTEQIGQNLLTKTYNPDQGLTEGVGGAMAMGAVLPAVFKIPGILGGIHAAGRDIAAAEQKVGRPLTESERGEVIDARQAVESLPPDILPRGGYASALKAARSQWEQMLATADENTLQQLASKIIQDPDISVRDKQSAAYLIFDEIQRRQNAPQNGEMPVQGRMGAEQAPAPQPAAEPSPFKPGDEVVWPSGNLNVPRPIERFTTGPDGKQYAILRGHPYGVDPSELQAPPPEPTIEEIESDVNRTLTRQGQERAAAEKAARDEQVRINTEKAAAARAKALADRTEHEARLSPEQWYEHGRRMGLAGEDGNPHAPLEDARNKRFWVGYTHGIEEAAGVREPQPQGRTAPPVAPGSSPAERLRGAAGGVSQVGPLGRPLGEQGEAGVQEEQQIGPVNPEGESGGQGQGQGEPGVQEQQGTGPAEDSRPDVLNADVVQRALARVSESVADAGRSPVVRSLKALHRALTQLQTEQNPQIRESLTEGLKILTANPDVRAAIEAAGNQAGPGADASLSDDDVLRLNGWPDSELSKLDAAARKRVADKIRDDAERDEAVIRDGRAVLEGLNDGDKVVDRFGTEWTLSSGLLQAPSGTIGGTVWTAKRGPDGKIARGPDGKVVREFTPDADAIRLASFTPRGPSKEQQDNGVLDQGNAPGGVSKKAPEGHGKPYAKTRLVTELEEGGVPRFVLKPFEGGGPRSGQSVMPGAAENLDDIARGEGDLPDAVRIKALAEAMNRRGELRGIDLEGVGTKELQAGDEWDLDEQWSMKVVRADADHVVIHAQQHLDLPVGDGETVNPEPIEFFVGRDEVLPGNAGSLRKGDSPSEPQEGNSGHDVVDKTPPGYERIEIEGDGFEDGTTSNLAKARRNRIHQESLSGRKVIIVREAAGDRPGRALNEGQRYALYMESGKAEEPAFKQGDRVSRVVRGEKLTGTVQNVSADGELTVNVDQIKKVGGVPIGRIEYWHSEGTSKVGDESEPEADEAKAGRDAATQILKDQLEQSIRDNLKNARGTAQSGIDSALQDFLRGDYEAAAMLLRRVGRVDGGDVGHNAIHHASRVEDLAKRIKDGGQKLSDTPRDYGTIDKPNRAAISKHFAGKLADGQAYPTIFVARQEAGKLLDGTVGAGTAAAKQVDEAMEMGVVRAAREIVSDMRKAGATAEQIYSRLRGLYEQQPNLAVRTSESIAKQAYSTPAPIAWVASELAGIGPDKSVLEPTAGNGMLLIGANPENARAVELDRDRADNLRAMDMARYIQGEGDATKSTFFDQNYDAVITNPPFGAIPGGGSVTLKAGLESSALDHVIAWKALRHLKESGSAVLILGGPSEQVQNRGDKARQDFYNGKSRLDFWYSLYKQFNVVGHYTIAGDLYAKQGAKFPIDMVVIRGRGEATRPMPMLRAPEQINDFDELGKLLSDPGLAVSGPEAGGGGPQSGGGGAAGGNGGDQESGGVGPSSRGPTGVGGKGAGSDQPGGRGGAGGGSSGDLGGTGSKQGPAPSDRGSGSQSGGVRRPGGGGRGTSNGEGAADAGGGSGGGGGNPPELGGRPDGGGGVAGGKLGGMDAEAKKRLDALAKKLKDKLGPAPGNYGGVRKIGTNEWLDAIDEAEGRGTVGFPAAPDPEIFAIGSQMGQELFDAGIKGFGEFVQSLHQLVGDAVLPYAKEIYTATYMLQEPEVQGELTPLREVNAATETQLREAAKSGRLEAPAPKKQEPKPPAKQEAAPLEQDQDGNIKQTTYQTKSKLVSMDTLVPTNMRDAIQQALEEVEKAHGPIDDYVAKELGYTPEQLAESFAAEQVDAIGMALHNMANRSGFILGDQTGVGKGRVNAAVIRWAIRQDGLPIFLTHKPNLYADMLRDLTDIGESTKGKPFSPLLTNKGDNSKVTIPAELPRPPWAAEGVMGPFPNHDQVLTEAVHSFIDDGSLTAKARGKKVSFDALFTTYNQLQQIAGRNPVRAELIALASPHAFFVMDESHNAGGSGPATRKVKPKPGEPQKVPMSRRIREMVGQARGVFYSSATFAKRPEVMDLYFTTDMRKSVPTLDSLTDAVSRGGIPLQQTVSAMLARAGQYLRREKSFDGIAFASKVLKTSGEAADAVSDVTGRIFDFDLFTESIVDALGGVGGVSAGGGRGQKSATKTSFSSILHNIVDNALLAAKADVVVEDTLAELKAGKKVMIGVSKTMGSFIEDAAEGLKPGELLNLTFADVMLRYLEKCRWYSRVVPGSNGQKVPVRLTDAELGPRGVQMFNDLKAAIKNNSELRRMPASPLDYIMQKLREATHDGRPVKVAEVTGRKHILDYSTPDRGIRYMRRGSKDIGIQARQAVVYGFNGKPGYDPVDVVFTNRAGSTGLSLHASPKNGSDTRPRHMIIAQAESNIDEFMQLLGRINRTGQINKPSYTLLLTDLPIELRPAAALMRKMANLNANTTAARTHTVSFNMPDFLNQIGDRVIADFMEEREDIHSALKQPLLNQLRNDGSYEPEGAARKVTGRIILLPVKAQQEFYDEILARYEDAIKQHDALGTNPLQARTLDLKAETLSKFSIFDGDPNDPSPFASGAQVELARVNRIAKPFKPGMVRDQVQKFYGPENEKSILADMALRRKTWVDSTWQIVNDNSKREWRVRGPSADEGPAPVAFPSHEKAQEWVDKQAETLYERGRKLEYWQQAVNAQRAKYADWKIKTIEDETDAWIKKEVADYRERIKSKPDITEADITDKVAQYEKRLGDQLFDLRSFLRAHQPGEQVALTFSDSGDVMYGVITGIIRKGSAPNPAALGAWKVRMAVVDEAREVTLSVRQFIGRGQQAAKARLSPIMSEEIKLAFGAQSIWDAFEKSQSISREERYIATGNLLAAYAQDVVPQGQIIMNFTRGDGSLGQGVLLPRNFDPAVWSAEQPFQLQSAEEVRAFLNSAGVSVYTRDQALEVESRGSGIRLTAPKSKSAGGQYHQNAAILEAAKPEAPDGFVSSGGNMVLDVKRPETVQKVLQALFDQGFALYAFEKKDIAAAQTGRRQIGEQDGDTTTGHSISGIPGLGGDVPGQGGLFGQGNVGPSVGKQRSMFGDMRKEPEAKIPREPGESDRDYAARVKNLTAKDPTQMSFAELQDAAGKAGIDKRVGRKEMERQLREKRGDVVGAPSHAFRQPRTMSGENRAEVSAEEIIRKIREVAGTPIRYGHGAFKRRKALGWYSLNWKIIRQEKANDLGTALHEAGHAIHDKILGWKTPVPTPVLTALTKMGKELYGSRKPVGGYWREGVAEFVARYMLGDPNFAPMGPYPLTAEYQMVLKWWNDQLKTRPELAKGWAELKSMMDRWSQQGAVGRVMSHIDFMDSPLESISNAVTKLQAIFSRRWWVDDAAPLEAAEKTLLNERGLKLGDLPERMSPTILRTALKRTAPGTAESFIRDAAVNITGTPVGPSLSDVLQPVKKNLREFMAYAVAARGLDLLKRGIDPGITPSDADYAFRKLDTPEFRDALAGVTEWANRLVDYVVDSGGLSREAADHIRALNPVYIPFQRVFDETYPGPPAGPGKRGSVNQPKAIKSIKGSGRRIKNPIQALAMQAEQMISLGNKLRVARALVDLAGNSPGGGWFAHPVEAPASVSKTTLRDIKKQIERAGGDLSQADLEALITVYTQAGTYFGKDPIVTIWKGGKRTFWELDPDVYAVVTDMDKQYLPAFLNAILGPPKRLVQLGATSLKASFSLIRNPIRDMMTWNVYSQSRHLTPLAAMKGLWHELRKDPDAQRWKALGGEMTTLMGQDRIAAQRKVKEALARGGAEKAMTLVRHPLDAARELLGAFEASPRIVEFKAMLAKKLAAGADPESAVIAALAASKDVTTNFTRAGIVGEVLNGMTAFFNAKIQGTDKFYRTFGGGDGRGAAVRATARAFAWITIPSLLLWWLNKDEDWYKNLPKWRRLGCWNFSLDGGNTIVSIPKPFELGYVFGSVPEAVAERMYGADTGLLSTAMWETLSGFVPGLSPMQLVPDALRPPIEEWANREAFTGKAIVPARDQHKAPSEQYARYTTETAKAIGRLLNVAPYRVEHLMSGYTGGLLLDAVRASEGVMNTERIDSLADWPLVGTLFARNPTGQGRFVDDFYQALDAAQTAAKSADAGAAAKERARRLERAATEMSKVRQSMRKGSRSRDDGLAKIDEIAKAAMAR